MPPGPEGNETDSGSENRPAAPATAISRVTLRVSGIPASKARDLVKVAVLPLSAHSTEVTMDVVIHAEGGFAGIPGETLELVVLEGLRQLGLTDVKIEAETQWPACMPTIQVRNVPEETRDVLRRRAAEAGMSLQE